VTVSGRARRRVDRGAQSSPLAHAGQADVTRVAEVLERLDAWSRRCIDAHAFLVDLRKRAAG
jgi:hypothetical protein